MYIVLTPYRVLLQNTLNISVNCNVSNVFSSQNNFIDRDYYTYFTDEEIEVQM
jgi:hypothetical protein